MKKFRFYAVLAAIFAGVAIFSGCDDSDSAVVYTEPEVTFSTEKTSFDISLGETVEITADVEPEGKVYIKWYVNEVLEATTGDFAYTFLSPGTHTISFSAKNGSGEVTRDFTVNVADVFDVELSIGDETDVTVQQFETLTVVAIVNSGENIVHSWSIDGTEVSTDRILEQQMTEAGRFEVKYSGHNSAGRYDRTFHVNVTEMGLYIEMSYTADTWVDWIEEDIEIVANVIYGGSTAVHDWKLNDQTVSTTNRFFKNFTKDEEGEYTLTYTCTTDTESFSKTYTITVWYAYLIDDFESYAPGQVTVTGVTFPYITPNSMNVCYIVAQSESEKDAVNSSPQVMLQNHGSNTGTSGIMDVWTNHVPNYTKATALRFKFHNLGNCRHIEAQYRSPNAEGPTLTIKEQAILNYDGWQDVAIEIDPELMQNYSGLRVRPLRSPSTVTQPNEPQCYVDEIYLCKY